MKKCSIFFFSGTGNTYFAAKRIAEALNEQGLDAVSLPIDSLTMAEIEWEAKSSDILGIGYPIYASSLPAPIERFLEVLPEVKQPRCFFVFCTHSENSGDGVHTIAKKLYSKGYIIIGETRFAMRSNIPFEPFHKKQTDITELNPEEFAKKIVAARPVEIHETKQFHLGKNKYKKLMKRFGAELGVNKRLCTLCASCAKYCPVSNIYMDENQVNFLDNCVSCMRCINFCKNSAITYAGKEPKKYPGPYNDFHPAHIYEKR